MSRPIGSAPLPTPQVITACSRVAIGASMLRTGAGAAASGASPWSDAANCILAFPFRLEAPATFYKGFVHQGSAGSNGTTWEVGIWDNAYNKIVTTGSFAGNASNDTPVVDALDSTYTLPPALYYAGCVHSATTTGQIHRWSVATTGIALWQSLGCWRQSGVTIGSLAATATPGDMTTISFPLFGLITRTGFDL